MLQGFYKAKKKGFTGTLKQFEKEQVKKKKAWGYLKQRVDGKLIMFSKCQNKKCQHPDYPHDQKGLCAPCYEKTRREYKLKKYYEYRDKKPLKKVIPK